MNSQIKLDKLLHFKNSTYDMAKEFGNMGYPHLETVTASVQFCILREIDKCQNDIITSPAKRIDH